MKKLFTAIILLILIACNKDGSSNEPAMMPVSGLSCDLYNLATMTPSQLPNFNNMGSPLASFVIDNPINFNNAVNLLAPSGVSLNTWFGLTCYGLFMVSETSLYKLKLTSDDGSKLYLDGYSILSNDGHHSAITKSRKVFMTAGEHELVLDYMQGVGQSVLKLESDHTLEFYNYE